MSGNSPASNEQIDRLYDAIDRRFGDDPHGGDVLDTVRDIVGRHDFDTWWGLSSDEIEKAIAGLRGR